MLDFSNREHVAILEEMGILLSSLPGGKVQISHLMQKAKTPEDAEEGWHLMQDIMRLMNQQQNPGITYVIWGGGGRDYFNLLVNNFIIFICLPFQMVLLKDLLSWLESCGQKWTLTLKLAPPSLVLTLARTSSKFPLSWLSRSHTMDALATPAMTWAARH